MDPTGSNLPFANPAEGVLLTLEPHLNRRTVDARKGTRRVRDGNKVKSSKRVPSLPMDMEMAYRIFTFYKRQPYAIFARKVLDRHVFEGGYRELWMGELERISTPEQRSELERKLRRAVFEYKILFGMCPYFYYQDDDDDRKDFTVPPLTEGKFLMEWSENLNEYRPAFRLNRDTDRPVGLYVWEEPLPDGNFGGPFPFLLDRWTVVKRLYSDLQTASHWASNPFNFLQARKTADPRLEDLPESVRFGGDVLTGEDAASGMTPQTTEMYQRNRLQSENLEMKLSMLDARNNGAQSSQGQKRSRGDGDPRRLADRIREPMDGGNYFFLPPDMERASLTVPATPKELERVETLMQEDLSLSVGIPKMFLSGIHTSTRSSQAKEVLDFVQTTVLEARNAMADFYFRVHSEMHEEEVDRIVDSALRRIAREKARLKKKKEEMEAEEAREKKNAGGGENKEDKKKKKKTDEKGGREGEHPSKEELDRAILLLKEQRASLRDVGKESLGFVLRFNEAPMVDLEQILVLAENGIISPAEKVSLGRRAGNIPDRDPKWVGSETGARNSGGTSSSSDQTKSKRKRKPEKERRADRDEKEGSRTRDRSGGKADREPPRKSAKKDGDKKRSES